MKNLYYRVVKLDDELPMSYCPAIDSFDDGLLSDDKHRIKDFFIACAISNELKKKYPEDCDKIWVDSFQTRSMDV